MKTSISGEVRRLSGVFDEAQPVAGRIGRSEKETDLCPKTLIAAPASTLPMP